jgi:hypothetical protein
MTKIQSKAMNARQRIGTRIASRMDVRIQEEFKTKERKAQQEKNEGRPPLALCSPPRGEERLAAPDFLPASR